jgi:hypothetical protein
MIIRTDHPYHAAFYIYHGGTLRGCIGSATHVHFEVDVPAYAAPPEPNETVVFDRFVDAIRIVFAALRKHREVRVAS